MSALGGKSLFSRCMVLTAWAEDHFLVDIPVGPSRGPLIQKLRLALVPSSWGAFWVAGGVQ